MDALGQRRDLQRFGIDPKSRKKDAGGGPDVVWNVFTFGTATRNHTTVPHLTLGLAGDGVTAMATLPNGAKKTPLRPLLADGREGFRRIVEDVLRGMADPVTGCPGIEPRLRIHHRHWTHRRKPPLYDAYLNADLRTLQGDTDAKVKRLPVWIDAAFQAFEAKWAAGANVELQLGAAFPSATCPNVRTREILDHIAAAWIACRPFIEKLGVDLPPEAEGT